MYLSTNFIMKIYAFTSYFSKLKNDSVLKDNFNRCYSISLYSKISNNLKIFAPSKKLLSDYKSNRINQKEYIKAYLNQIVSLEKKYSFNHLKNLIRNKILLCYEKSSNFCHRHILREYFLLNKVLILEYCNPLNIAIIGSRNFNKYTLLKSKIDLLKNSLLNNQKLHIVSGGAKGADSLAEKYANEYNITTSIFKANWDKYGKKAGFIRNHEIIKNSDLIITFWDGKSKGTRHSISLCKKYNKTLIIYYI